MVVNLIDRGSGIGLSITKMLINNLNIKIETFLMYTYIGNNKHY